MDQTTKTKVEHSHYDLLLEKKNILEFLSSKKMSLPPAFLDCFKAGDIIEIYSFPEHQQIYANKEFQKLSSYTAEQMRTIPFQKLFWRESEIQQRLIERAIEVVRGGGVPQPWGLPPHDLVESLHPRRRTFEMHLGWLTPVYNSEGSAIAWASTLTVEYIFEWPSDTDLN